VQYQDNRVATLGTSKVLSVKVSKKMWVQLV